MTDRYEKIRKALANGPTPGPWSVRYDYVVRTHLGKEVRHALAGFHETQRESSRAASLRAVHLKRRVRRDAWRNQ